MALTAAQTKALRQKVSNVPNLTTRSALNALIDALAADVARGATPIADGTINTAATPNLTTVNGIITAKSA